MKKFFEKYSYVMVKMFVNQCVIALFGNVLHLAALAMKSTAATIALGCFSALFYFFLVYMTAWNTGSKDKPAIDGGRAKLSIATGLFISLGANIPNLALATIHAVSFPLQEINVFSATCGISRVALWFINGMYTGFLNVIKIGGDALNTMLWPYFVIVIPSLIVSTVAYVLGAKDVHFTKLLLPVTPEELELKREKKAKHK